ncbi:MAG TPA: response regulator transcription factor [Polyangiaceae bacterium]|nr:response regulator transcription factor [Polyangiaceae bacterium]
MANLNDIPAGTRKILVIEDDPSITMGLELNLRAEGYGVLLAHDGEEGLEKAREGGVDLLILDVMLPRLNGFEVLRALRAEGREIPVLMLSARGAEIDKVMGLELGAEDYVTKPFGVAELMARVRRILRRDGKARAQRDLVFRAGLLEINSATREVRRSGQSVDLTATEFEVLWCLVEAKGRVLSREQIQSNVWGPEHHGTTRTVDNFLLQLRAKLEDDPAEPRHLVTVRGVGYRFIR